MPRKQEGILIPTNVVESLLVAITMSDKAAIQNVGATIKEIAEDQEPEKFNKPDRR